MENKNSAFKEFISPILVLVLICFVVTFLLAFTYGITKPIIDENTAKAASEARMELLSDADNFSDSGAELFELEPGKVYAVDAYTADNGAGMVVTVKSNSYGGLLTAMVGIDKDGAITGVKITEHADTPGVGTKAQDPGHLSQYVGLSELSSEVIKDHADSVVEVTGASVSSSTERWEVLSNGKEKQTFDTDQRYHQGEPGTGTPARNMSVPRYIFIADQRARNGTLCYGSTDLFQHRNFITA